MSFCGTPCRVGVLLLHELLMLLQDLQRCQVVENLESCRSGLPRPLTCELPKLLNSQTGNAITEQ